MASLLPLLVAVPLGAAGLLVVIGERPRIHLFVLFSAMIASASMGIVLIFGLPGEGAIAHGVGSWAFGIAIPLAADMFSALMLTATGLISIACTAFAVASGIASSRYFAPMMLVLLAGVNGALLTADLFNLFVFIEVMLLPSCGLFILAPSNRGLLRQVEGARLFVTINLLTSTIFLVGVGFVYGTMGTVNLAQLAGAARGNDAVAIAIAVCFFALGIKASVVPIHGWLGRAYPSTSPAITALFSALHSKVAVYAMYRIYSVVFDGETRYLWIGIALFSLTMVVGVFAAVGENATRPILAFHMVSQIGYILLGLALFTELGLAAGIFYLIHHMIVKAALFLSTGAVEVRHGTSTLGRFSGISRREPILAGAFFIAALSMAGIPPFSGFVAKLSLIMASLDAGQVAATVAMLMVSLVTLLSMLKIWSGMFWGQRDSSSSDETAEYDHTGNDSGVVAGARGVPRVGVALSAPAVFLAAVTVVFGLGAQTLMSLSQTAAQGLLDPSEYIRAVMGS